jgi:hypothetical protein
MRAFIAGLLVALLACSAPSAIAAPADKLAPVTLDDINAGMGAAPGLVSQGGLDCQVSDARKIGVDDKTQSTFYELACKGAEGFIFGEPAKKSKYAMVIYSCLEAATSKSAFKFGATCRLPENADPKAGIAALIASDHPGCAMTDARGVGHTDASTVLEVACQGGAGYVVEASYPLSLAKPAKFTPCAGLRPDMHTQCALTDAAAANAYVTSLPARAGKTCAVANHRYVGFGNDGDDYYEVACAGGGGLMLDVDAAGDVYPTACVQADYIGGGCKLTKPH